MKKNIYILFISIIFSFSSCSKDDDTAGVNAGCLTCASFPTPICVGDIDDETGEVVTEQDLDDSKAIFELLGISCTKS